MSKVPTAVEIRGYQVGFGDCFLLSFIYGDADKKHVLIDFGTVKLPGKGAKPSVHMKKVAESIKEITGNKLTAVVATHRHKDHISGFATDNSSGKSGELIRDMKPDLVLQPWTEDPKAARDAKAPTTDSNRSPKKMLAGLQSMHIVAEQIYSLAQSNQAWMGPVLQKQLAFIGQDNIANLSAVKNLMDMGNKSRAVWAHHGSDSGLEQLLPGVKVHVLGPPTLEQSSAIKRQRAKDPDEFWNLLAGAAPGPSTVTVARGVKKRGSRGRGSVPPEGRWFRDQLDRMRGQSLLQIVRTLDGQMNNTSLILLFEVCGKKLLFPGDAQLENWAYALRDAPDAAKTQALLADVNVLKVGHHGSTNATPKGMLWDHLQNRKKAGKKKLTTMMSTMPGTYSGVPSTRLKSALVEETSLLTTTDLKGKDAELFIYTKIE